MFLSLNDKPQNKLAIIDDKGLNLSYSHLVQDINYISSFIDERELIFCFCENSVESLTGYLSFYHNKDVALLLSSKMDMGFVKKLISEYMPTYLWLPIHLNDHYNYEVITKYHDYCLVKTNFKNYPISDKLSFLLMTSGSTGSSKLVRHKYGNLEYSARAVAESLGWTDSERSICNLPMNYTMGLSVINSTLYAGGTVLLCNDMMRPDFWGFVNKHKGTNITGVPYGYTILDKLRFTQMELPHLLTICQGGGKLTEKEFVKLAEYAKNTNRRFIATYGTTETTARVTMLDPEKSLEKTLSIGKPIKGDIIYLINEDGEKILDSKTDGELVIEGPNVTMGYADCREDLLNDDDFNGQYRTGDIAKRDNDGYYYIVGRYKRFLKLYGLRISLDECEKLVRNKFNVECACTGNDNGMIVYITDYRLTDQVTDFVTSTIGLSKHAFNVYHIKKIPKNNNGKIMYGYLLNR